MRKKLANFGERQLHDEIVGVVASYRADVYRKIRIADVIDIDKLSTRRLGTYALQAHFDICVADENHEPAFAIEYDGRGHDPSKDGLKNAIAQEANLALFRVAEPLLNHTRGNMTFLQYLVHTWFLGREFLRMQKAGEVAYDEPFMMSGFLKPNAKHIFDSEFDFLGRPRGRLDRLMKEVRGPDEPFAHLDMAIAVLGRNNSNFVSFASVPLGDGHAYGRGRIDIGTPCLGPLEGLPFGWSALSDYCEGMAADDLCENVALRLGSGGHVALTREDVFSQIDVFRAQGFHALRAACGNDRELVDRAMRKLA